MDPYIRLAWMPSVSKPRATFRGGYGAALDWHLLLTLALKDSQGDLCTAGLLWRVELEQSIGPHPGIAAVFPVDEVLSMHDVDRQRHVQEQSRGPVVLSGAALFERRVEGAHHHNLRLCGQTEGCTDLGNDAVHISRSPHGSRVDCVLRDGVRPGGYGDEL